MSTEQHDAYGEELSRISRHQRDAVTARLRLFEVLVPYFAGHRFG
ncbi:hypothetical protein [Actinacidiphila soli]|nr:hypothetical protein [Actinacidiphila soli]